MRYRIEITGIRPIIMHNGAAGLDTRSAANLEKKEINRKKGSLRTTADEDRLAELECQTSLWLNFRTNEPEIPAGAIRKAIETGARKLKQGPNVREGLIVENIDEFKYDRSLGTTVEELGKSTQFTTGVVVQRSRILRTRAKFDEWGLVFTIEGEDALVQKEQLEQWLTIAGNRIGLGDWRPEKSGDYGRFALVSIEELGD